MALGRVLKHATWAGEAISDREILSAVPEDLVALLEQTNGFLAYGGGFHLRGASAEPEWHSLRAAWVGSLALHALFESVEPNDIPFGQECMGDQFLLRAGAVMRLNSETDEVQRVSGSLGEFIASVADAPVSFLGLEPLVEFQRGGGSLRPGEALNVYPPFSFSQSAQGVSYRAVPVREQIDFLAHVSSQLKGVPDGASVRFEIS